jgi:RNA-directed DNA polymerase
MFFPVDRIESKSADLQAARSVTDLARCLEVPPGQLNFHLKRHEHEYQEIIIPKRGGGERTLLAPARELKRIQHQLYQILCPLFFHRQSAHGFIRTRSIITNAAPHVGRRTILNLDLENFFGSIHPGRVSGALTAKPFELTVPVARAIALLCTARNGLPQGAPSSPFLANVVAWTLDRDLERLAKKYRCHYTRYADDITFSTNAQHFPPAIFDESNRQLGGDLTIVIESNGFKPNEKKTRLQRRSSARQSVTGLVVNEKLNVDRRFVREIRAVLHSIKKHGLEAAQKRFEMAFTGANAFVPSLKSRLAGQIGFVGQIRGRHDSIYKRFVKVASNLIPEFAALPVVSEQTLLDRLQENVWVIEACLDGDKPSDTLAQGTAFWLSGVGLVTNHHVLVKNCVVFSSTLPDAKYPASVVCEDEHRDLAILKVDALGDSLSPPGLSRGDSSLLAPMSEVVVAGFPDHSPGATISVKQAKVSSFKPKHGVGSFQLDSGITKGNSGGPVVTPDGHVVGVAVTGGDSEKETKAAVTYGVIRIEEIDHLVASLQAE